MVNGASDPVCGMTVDPARAAGHTDYKGQTYYFCGTSCLKKFTADPDRYLAPKPSPHAVKAVEPLMQIGRPGSFTPENVGRPFTGRHVMPAPSDPPGTIYTCPMHPEVRQDHPGACPKCGMALEPLVSVLSPEEADSVHPS